MGVLVLDGWDEPDLAVQAAVVEPVDVLRDRDLEVVDVLPRALVADQLGLDSELNASARALCRTNPGRPDGRDRAGVGEPLGVPEGDEITGYGDEHALPRPDTTRPPSPVELLTRIVARDGAQHSATSMQRQLTDPSGLLGDAADRYTDSITVAATNRLCDRGLAELQDAAERDLLHIEDHRLLTQHRSQLLAEQQHLPVVAVPRRRRDAGQVTYVLPGEPH